MKVALALKGLIHTLVLALERADLRPREDAGEFLLCLEEPSDDGVFKINGEIKIHLVGAIPNMVLASRASGCLSGHPNH